MTTYEEAIGKAREIGWEHGENAAAWWEQEARVFLSSPPNMAMMLAGLDSGDPIVLDNLPAPDLSGEWTDGYTPQRLYVDCGGTMTRAQDYSDDIGADLCDAYEEAFSEAVETAVRAACESALSE